MSKTEKVEELFEEELEDLDATKEGARTGGQEKYKFLGGGAAGGKGQEKQKRTAESVSQCAGLVLTADEEVVVEEEEMPDEDGEDDEMIDQDILQERKDFNADNFGANDPHNNLSLGGAAAVHEDQKRRRRSRKGWFDSKGRKSCRSCKRVFCSASCKQRLAQLTPEQLRREQEGVGEEEGEGEGEREGEGEGEGEGDMYSAVGGREGQASVTASHNLTHTTAVATPWAEGHWPETACLYRHSATNLKDQGLSEISRRGLKPRRAGAGEAARYANPGRGLHTRRMLGLGASMGPGMPGGRIKAGQYPLGFSPYRMKCITAPAERTGTGVSWKDAVCVSKMNIQQDILTAVRMPTTSVGPLPFAPTPQRGSSFELGASYLAGISRREGGRSKEPGWECEICEDGGLLILCDLCGKGYHARCLGLENASALPDNWYCKACDPKHATVASYAQPLSLFSHFRTRTGPQLLAEEAAEGHLIIDKVMGYSRSGRLRKKSRLLMAGEQREGEGERRRGGGGGRAHEALTPRIGKDEAARSRGEGSASSQGKGTAEETVQLSACLPDVREPEEMSSRNVDRGSFIKDPCALCGVWINRGGAMTSHMSRCTGQMHWPGRSFMGTCTGTSTDALSRTTPIQRGDGGGGMLEAEQEDGVEGQQELQRGGEGVRQEEERHSEVGDEDDSSVYDKGRWVMRGIAVFQDGEDEIAGGGDTCDEGHNGLEMLLEVCGLVKEDGVTSTRDATNLNPKPEQLIKIKVNRCGKCKALGHKITTCPLLGLGQSDTTSSAPA